MPVPVNPLSPQAANSVCRFQFSNFNDLVNQEDHYQLYAEVNYELTDKLRFHGEAAWNRNNVPDQRLSPANLSTQFPTPTTLGGTSGSTAVPGALNFFVRYNVPANNPGLIDLYTTCAPPLTTAQCTAGRAAGGLDDIADHRPATNRHEHLRQVGTHPLALTGRQDDRQWFRHG